MSKHNMWAYGRHTFVVHKVWNPSNVHDNPYDNTGNYRQSIIMILTKIPIFKRGMTIIPTPHPIYMHNSICWNQKMHSLHLNQYLRIMSSQNISQSPMVKVSCNYYEKIEFVNDIQIISWMQLYDVKKHLNSCTIHTINTLNVRL